MAKYSGIWTPDRGDGEPEHGAPSPSPSSSRYSGVYTGGGEDWQTERERNRVRLAAWMKGNEPRQWFEEYGSKESGSFSRFFCMEFPKTVHYFVVAWEPWPEFGRLFVWCFGCKDAYCGACKWARAAYLADLKEGARLRGSDPDAVRLRHGFANENDLPF